MAFNWFKKLKNSTEKTAEPTTDHSNDSAADNTLNSAEEQSDERVSATTTPTQVNQTPKQAANASTVESSSSVTPSDQAEEDKHREHLTVNQNPIVELQATSAQPQLPSNEASPQLTIGEDQDDQAPSQKGYFQRLKQGLSKTRSGFADLFMGKKALNEDLIDELEMQLLTADVGIEVTDQIIAKVTDRINRKELEDMNAVQTALMSHMHELLTPYAEPIALTHKPFVMLMTGINGAGKTTTIGKLAHFYKSQGKKVMLAAGDTFRAAAVEQLQTWGERNHVPVIAQATGSDAASVAYDALQSAKARDIDVLIIDTAGRLHTQNHLMEELKKIKRVLQKLDETAPHETMLVIDAGNGQNALRQAQEFHQAMAIDGITITKLDGTAKGGILFAITHNLHLPIRFIGVGEKQTDLRPFNAMDFVNALLYSE